MYCRLVTVLVLSKLLVNDAHRQMLKPAEVVMNDNTCHATGRICLEQYSISERTGRRKIRQIKSDESDRLLSLMRIRS